MKRISAWYFFIVYYIVNRRSGWSHHDLSTIRKISYKW